MMKLVENWRSAWRWISVQCMVVALAAQAVWEALPADLKSGIPQGWVSAITIGLLALGIIGRMVKQDDSKPNQ